MTHTIAKEDQFEFTESGVRHKPTGAQFFVYPRHDQPHQVNWGEAGNVLENGDDFRQDEIETIARRLIAKRANGLL